MPARQAAAETAPELAKWHQSGPSAKYTFLYRV
jgi:hypothetical protein